MYMVKYAKRDFLDYTRAHRPLLPAIVKHYWNQSATVFDNASLRTMLMSLSVKLS